MRDMTQLAEERFQDNRSQIEEDPLGWALNSIRCDLYAEKVQDVGLGEYFRAVLAQEDLEPVLRILLSLPPLTWTDRPPTEAGWYWAEAEIHDGYPFVVHVGNDPDGVFSSCGTQRLSEVARFAGPLPLPQEDM